jgi:hypothetical protein
MTWKTPLAKAVANTIANRHGIVKTLLRNEEVAEDILADKSLLVELFGEKGPWEALLQDPDIRKTLKLDTQAAEWVDPELILAYQTRETFQSVLLRADELGLISVEALIKLKGPKAIIPVLPIELLLKSLTPETMMRYVGAESILSHLSADAMLEHLGMELMLEHIGAEGMFKHLGVESMLEHVGADAMLEHLGVESMLEHVGADAMLEHLGMESMLEHVGADAMLEHLGVESMLEYVGAETMLDYLGMELMLEHIGADAMLEHLGVESMLEHVGAKKLLEHLGADVLLNYLSVDSMIDFLGTPTLLSYLNDEQLVEHLGADTLYNSLSMDELVERVELTELLSTADPDGQALASFLNERPELLKDILKDLNIHESTVDETDFNDEQLVMDGAERLNALSYSLPAVVVSFPRTGSNYLQSILMHSSGTHNISIYSQNPSAFAPLLSVKSHALSPEYLQDEYERIMEREYLPEKILLIKRDPRDVMISFYEYTQKQRGVHIDQNDFLEEVCFFYASTIDKLNSRRVETAPLNIVDTYKKHIRQWFSERPEGLDVLELCYEDLVEKSEKTFERALRYLELDVPVAKEFLGVKVSLYSEEDRNRGIAYGWQHTGKHYASLVKKVESLLADEIKFLGYSKIKKPLHKRKRRKKVHSAK